jgi:hypothetical protein
VIPKFEADVKVKLTVKEILHELAVRGKGKSGEWKITTHDLIVALVYVRMSGVIPEFVRK